MTNHKKLIDVTGPEQRFFSQTERMLKIDQSKKRRDIGPVWDLHAPFHWVPDAYHMF